jgi:hypothetical protein
MGRWAFVAITLAALAALAAPGCNDIPSTTLSAMQHADRYELLSLDPSRIRTTPPPGNFHGWRVLGRTSIDDLATRQKLTNALRAGARENGSMAALCFKPRHGIHVVVHGSNVRDLVICFECLQVEVFENGQAAKGFLISDSPQPVFDDALRVAGIPLAEKR